MRHFIDAIKNYKKSRAPKLDLLDCSPPYHEGGKFVNLWNHVICGTPYYVAYVLNIIENIHISKPGAQLVEGPDSTVLLVQTLLNLLTFLQATSTICIY